MEFEIDYNRIREEISKSGAKKVVLQLAEGIRPYFKEIVDKIDMDDVEFFIWGGSAFGGCDVPIHLERYGFDMIVHIGHDEWK